MGADKDKLDAITSIGDAISSTVKIIFDAIGDNPNDELLDAAVVAAGTGFSACAAGVVDTVMRSVSNEMMAEDAAGVVTTMIGATLRKTIKEMIEDGKPNDYAREALGFLDKNLSALCPDEALEALEDEDEDAA